MESPHVRSVEIVRRLRMEFPVQVLLYDPITGAEFSIKRDNILSMLVLDAASLTVEGQTYAAMFAEMARGQRACEKLAASAAVEHTAWKATIAKEHRAKALAEKRKATNDECEEEYRTHPEYKERSMREKHWLSLAGLFEDLKTAFQMKGFAVSSQQGLQRGYERAERIDDAISRIAEMESEDRALLKR